MQAWITTSSTHPEAIVNPLNAACQSGFVPDEVYLLDTPGSTDAVDKSLETITTIINQYGGDEPEIELTMLEREVEFGQIHDYVRTAITTVQDRGGEVAVDITPGRKFMSAIVFTAGVRYDADHVFYLYVASTDHFGVSYPKIPRTATDLYDFTEEL
jgi:hypothetical protein